MVAKAFNDNYYELQTEQFRKIDSFITFLVRSTGALRKKDTITVLHQAQQICGFISYDIQRYVAEKLNVNIAEIEATINFYEYFIKESQSDRKLSPC